MLPLYWEHRFAEIPGLRKITQSDRKVLLLGPPGTAQNGETGTLGLPWRLVGPDWGLVVKMRAPSTQNGASEELNMHSHDVK